MRPSALLGVVVLAALPAGCGENAREGEPAASGEKVAASPAPEAPSPTLATETVEVTEVNYHGWPALRMSNGLVVLVAVPAIGGRVMEYQLNGHPFLWTNPEEYGKTYPPPKTESERAWHNFGGYKVWPAPQSEWKGPGDPVGSQLDGGKWEGEVLTRAGQTAEIKLTSPPDPAVTGLQITRRVRLFAGSTHVEVSETFANVSDRTIRWSVWDVTQVPGSLSGDGKPSEKSCIYLPLNPESKLDGGYTRLIDDRAADPQWQVLPGLGVLRVSYRHLTGKIGADSQAGWIAYADEVNRMTFVKRFEVDKLGRYPDQGSTVEVYTSGQLPYMEVEVLSPLYELAPGREQTVVRQWYAAAFAPPLADTTEVGAVHAPFACVRRGDKLKLTGEFGVFAEGAAALSTVDEGGRTQDEIVSFPASPVTPLVIDREIAVPKTAAALALDLRNANGSPLGRLGLVSLADVRGE